MTPTTVRILITGGVPQGSVLGSPIWNILYDGLLRQPRWVSIVAYADDIAVIVVAKSIEDVQYLGDTAIEVVGDWLSEHELTSGTPGIPVLDFPTLAGNISF